MTDPEVELRLLLRDLSDAGPVPDDVAERLDETLARLVEGREASGGRPRWRFIAAGAVAASLIGVVAIGVGTLQHTTSGSTASAGAAVAPEASDLLAQDNALPSRTSTATTKEALQGAPTPMSGQVSPPSFSTPEFATEARDWWAANLPYTVPATCSGPWDSGSAQPLAAILDGSPAALVVSPPQGSSQLLQIYRCDDTTTPAAEATVRAR